ncbi:type 1 periplasmic binding fold superfamily protein [Flavobacterium sp. LS1P28]|uniref:type 1 periplasmic binding fold superfamily protein n=1 Tax=unclassified Flavobacterium TaxID=196869 RepID=UPI000F841EDE|nr:MULTISPECIES: type 1 periplasmic binding fold superfamily protein [unclassified Flavobacterium]RTY79622.1 type 1 periplasmic binding fold superfamily protein [Flavobacterium sp. LS1P28]RTY85694.1 type 1 periplasmic binding fold superfamily protein [Flavobacterium sp. RSP15]RTZ00019.1 type 1 periplasmic binding fold superfamily protein [Flavobacterium sp. RSP49]
MKNSKILAIALISISIFSSCSNDDPIAVNEEEVITTVTTTLTSGSQTVTMISRDLDGDGPNAPVITVSGDLVVNTTYTGAVSFQNESVSPVDDITLEIKEEGDEHQLFFQAPTAIGAFTYTDADVNGKPIGLTFTLKTGTTATTGNIVVILRHEPIKNAEGVASGNIANAGGATDAQITYPVQVK